jgi:hypothetical protein
MMPKSSCKHIMCIVVEVVLVTSVAQSATQHGHEALGAEMPPPITEDGSAGGEQTLKLNLHLIAFHLDKSATYIDAMLCRIHILYHCFSLRKLQLSHS